MNGDAVRAVILHVDLYIIIKVYSDVRTYRKFNPTSDLPWRVCIPGVIPLIRKACRVNPRENQRLQARG